jgi:hypothetical protein
VVAVSFAVAGTDESLSELRAQVIAFIASFSTSTPAEHQLGAYLLDAVISEISTEKRRNFTCFPHSQLHRDLVNRWKFILLLSPFVTLNLVDSYLAFAMKELSFDIQPSHRYYIEWFALRLFKMSPKQCMQIFLEKLREFSLKPSIVISIITIVTQMCRALKADEGFVELAANAILPWLSSLNSNVRIAAQSSLHVICTVCGDHVVPVAAKLMFAFIEEERVLRRRSGLLNEFFFGVFDSERDYCIEVKLHHQ